MKINPTNCPNCNFVLEEHGYDKNLISCHNEFIICKYCVQYQINEEVFIFIYGKEHLLKFRYKVHTLSLEIYMNSQLVCIIEDYVVDNNLTNIFNLFKKHEGNLIFT